MAWWMRTVADWQVHEIKGEAPMVRFTRDEDATMQPLNGRPPFQQLRELRGLVQVEPRGSPENDTCVDVSTNHYSVPWRLIGLEVTVQVDDGQVSIHHAGVEVACHDKHRGRRGRVIDRAHLHGIVPSQPRADHPR